MDNPVLKVFNGRFSISYKDEKMIYTYDEITHGLFRFEIDSKEVALVLSPIYIHRHTSKKIRGISKIGNEIILIPLFLNEKWIFYDLIKKTIRYYSPIKDKIKLIDAVTIGKKLFLIPENICDPALLVLLDNPDKIKFLNSWYLHNNEKVKKNVSIWGASSYVDTVVFPIVNTNYIYYVNDRGMNLLKIDNLNSIHSVSMSENGIWVLPMSGKCIYLVDFKGEILEKVDLSEIKSEVTANGFNRIIIVEEILFLLPIHGNVIYSYHILERQFRQIEMRGNILWGEFFVPGIAPYWDYILEDKKLHLLPLSYPYQWIDLDSLKSCSRSLSYGNNINTSEYWKMVGYVQGKNKFNETRNGLEEFIQTILFSHNGKEKDEINKKNAEIIWRILF